MPLLAASSQHPSDRPSPVLPAVHGILSIFCSTMPEKAVLLHCLDFALMTGVVQFSETCKPQITDGWDGSLSASFFNSLADGKFLVSRFKRPPTRSDELMVLNASSSASSVRHSLLSVEPLIIRWPLGLAYSCQT